MELQGEWRLDPAGRHQYRYWDGTMWTEHVSDNGQVSAEPYDGTVAAPPMYAQRLTSRGGVVMAPAGGTTVIVKRSHGCLWALGIVGVLVVLVVIIAVVAIGKAAHDLSKEQASHAITQTQFDAVPLGISESALETQLGKPPEDTQEFVQKGILSRRDIQSSCVYYNEKGQSFGSRFQFCFTGDSLDAKNAY